MNAIAASITSARMSSPRIEQVFYNFHSKVSHYALRHTSHRLRSAVEHGVLVLAVCTFCAVILSHRTFVHREDIASIARGGGATCAGASAAPRAGAGGDGPLGFIGEGRGVSVYSIVVQMLWTGYARLASKRLPAPGGKKIPGTCLKGILGFREDADVNHVLLRYDREENSNISPTNAGSRAFTAHRGSQGHEQIVSGMPINATQQFRHCVIGASPESKKQQTPGECSPQIASFLAHRGYIFHDLNAILDLRQQEYSEIIYSYSYSQGLLRLPPSLQHIHNVSTQFIIVSTADARCFGEAFARSLVFRLVGPDTVILNWILGLQHAVARPRYVHHWKTKKELDLDAFDMDRYAFSGTSTGDDRSRGGYETMRSTSTSPWPFASMNRVQKYPAYRFLRFLAFKFLVLLSTLVSVTCYASLLSFGAHSAYLPLRVPASCSADFLSHHILGEFHLPRNTRSHVGVYPAAADAGAGAAGLSRTHHRSRAGKLGVRAHPCGHDLFPHRSVPCVCPLVGVNLLRYLQDRCLNNFLLIPRVLRRQIPCIHDSQLSLGL